MKRICAILAALAALILLAATARAASFELDIAHSSIEFKVKHMAISRTRGSFTDFTGFFEFEPDKPETWRAEATIQAASIDTDNVDRDNHLRSEDFLFVEEHPTITFRSTGIEMEDDYHGKMSGELTIRGVAKPVELALEVRGMVADPWGKTRAGFAASGAINRKDYGLTWHKVLETGGLVVGDKVEILIEIEGIMKEAGGS
jgi:polyisoprenoid-binding protein YceI